MEVFDPPRRGQGSRGRLKACSTREIVEFGLQDSILGPSAAVRRGVISEDEAVLTAALIIKRTSTWHVHCFITSPEATFA